MRKINTVCAIALTLMAGCTKFQALDAVVPSCGYVRTSNQPYGNLPVQKLDVYKPKDAKSPAKVVIFFYGGNWQNGSKEDYRFVAQALSSRGFVAILPDYTRYPAGQFPAFLEDGALAVRWAHDNAARFGGDPDHIYLMGHSAGAHIAALLTLDAHYLKDAGLDRAAIRGTVALSGPYDFLPGPDDRPVFGMARDSITPDPRIEPITFVDGHAPPMLLIHGLKDETVGADNAIRLAERIREKGGQVRYIAYPDRAHVGVVLSLAWPFRWLAPTLDDAATFINEH